MTATASLDEAPALPASDEAATAVADAPPCPDAGAPQASRRVDRQVLAAPVGAKARWARGLDWPPPMAASREKIVQTAASQLACAVAAELAELSVPSAVE